MSTSFGNISAASSGNKIYIDDVSLTGIDSVEGDTYTIDITTLTDFYKYYYQHYGYWIKENGDTIWAYSNIDSLITPEYYDCSPSPFTFTNITDAGLDSASYYF